MYVENWRDCKWEYLRVFETEFERGKLMVFEKDLV